MPVLSFGCTPSRPAFGSPATCTATVTDTNVDPRFPWTPAGSVDARFPYYYRGGFVSGPCRLAPTGEPGQASCSFLATPTESFDFFFRAHWDLPGSFYLTTPRYLLSPTRSVASVSCAPNAVKVGSPTQCTATLFGGIGSPPSGTITFSRNSSGKFSPGTCVLVAASPGPPFSLGKSSCTVTYTPGAVDSGSHRVYLVGQYAFTDVIVS